MDGALAGGVRVRMPDDSDLQATVFSDDEHLPQHVPGGDRAERNGPPRSIVRLATDQSVPTDAVGTMIQWSTSGRTEQLLQRRLRLAASRRRQPGRRVHRGPACRRSADRRRLSVQRNSGGTQRSVGLFLQDVFSIEPTSSLTLSARVDSWKNYDGHIFETTVATGLPTAGNRGALPDADDTVVSPRAAALYKLSRSRLGVGRYRLGIPRADAQRALSPVQRRSARTLANETLGPERLFGGEAGVRLETTRNSRSARRGTTTA